MRLDVMTPYEINRAIAKEAGCTFDESNDIWNGLNGEELSSCPYFYDDLNEINKLERNLTDSKDILSYRQHLIQITTGNLQSRVNECGLVCVIHTSLILQPQRSGVKRI